MAQLLRLTVRSGDTVVRLGGDEFGVILEADTRVAQKICGCAGDFRFVHGIQRLRVGTSIGLVALDERWGSTGALLQAADTSCYAAKKAGRNRVHTWFETDKTMQGCQVDMQWTTRLEQALDDNGFVLLAQRIESLRNSKAGLHAEVLLRMGDADGSLIAPGAFLRAAERFSMATRIDRWVLCTSVLQLTKPRDISRVDTLCINLSGQSVSYAVFQRDAIDFLTESGADVCRRICLEITETAAVTHVAETMVFIKQMRALGVRIALLDVAHVMGLTTVAEFVNSPQILAHLRTIGFDFAQEYHLHEPEALANVLNAAPTACVM